MAHRFLIASLIPESVSAQLRQLYQQSFQQPCSITLFHTTFIPPFTTSNPAAISTFLTSLPPFSAHYYFGLPSTFTTPHRLILYLPLLPQRDLSQTHQHLTTTLAKYLTIETTHFAQEKIPEFLPHVTLSYHFESLANLYLPPTDTFSLPRPQLLVEVNQGIWESYST